MRLRRTSPGTPGISRRRHGRGFVYRDVDGKPVADEQTAQRIAALTIPPAWTHVWISTHANGHLQAVGTDSAGRRQYIYHPDWVRQRDGRKHERVVDFGRSMPRARRLCSTALRPHELSSDRVLAAAFRILDVGAVRIGSEAYAAENGSFGLATMLREHATVSGHRVTFEYIAKGGQWRRQELPDPSLARIVSDLLDRNDPSPELLAWQDAQGWHDVTSADINAYIRQVTRGEFTAKDFRTWNATVLMAQLLAFSEPSASSRQRSLTVRSTYEKVAEYLGNTPAIARASYVDSRVVDLYNNGVTLPTRVLPKRRADLPVHPAVERAVVRMLESSRDSHRT